MHAALFQGALNPQGVPFRWKDAASREMADALIAMGEDMAGQHPGAFIIVDAHARRADAADTAIENTSGPHIHELPVDLVILHILRRDRSIPSTLLDSRVCIASRSRFAVLRSA